MSGNSQTGRLTVTLLVTAATWLGLIAWALYDGNVAAAAVATAMMAIAVLAIGLLRIRHKPQ
jgi:hypothetical protein